MHTYLIANNLFLSFIKDGGHEFTVKGQPMSFSGTIAFVSGDNLGSQLIGGFKEGPGAHLKCRHCMGNSSDIKRMVIKPRSHRLFIIHCSDNHSSMLPFFHFFFSYEV